MLKDYYAILGIEKDASRKEIINSFRRLAKKYHPDKNKNPKASKIFKLVYEAYDILSEPSKRSRYNEIYEKHSEKKKSSLWG